MALAVPVDIVMDVVGQIRDKGKVERGWMGVGIGEDPEGRTVIGTVDKDSPAELAKLRPGDVVLKIGDKDVPGPDVLAAEIRRKKPGQDVMLKIERDGQPLDVKIKLGELAEVDAFKEMDVRFPGLFGNVPPNVAVKPKPGAPQPFEWSVETRKYIGVYCNELNRELAEHFGVKEGTGLLVSRLTEGGPAEKAKVKIGDVIVKVDGKRIGTVNELLDVVQAKEKGAKIKLEIVRDGKTTSLDVEVQEDKNGDFFESEDIQSLLESWQGYTDAFRGELQKWQTEGMPELRQSLKKLSPRGGQRRI